MRVICLAKTLPAVAATMLLLMPATTRAIDAGINIDIHQDILAPPAQLPTGFYLSGRIESGPPLGVPGGGGWSQPPILIDHVDDVFPQFNFGITPDLTDPGQNWFNFWCQWGLPPGAPGLPHCMPLHLGVLFDLNCHNVVIDVSGTWTLHGLPIQIGLNQGFVPIPGFRVTDLEEPQIIHLRNGNANGIPEPGEIETQVVQMEVLAVDSREELAMLLGPEPFRELRLGGMQESLPWVPVLYGGMPISEMNPYPFWPDSFFDVFLNVPLGPLTPQFPQPIPLGGFLLARERLMFWDNQGMIDYRWVWEFHEAHQAELGDAPDSTNSWGAGMTTYPWNAPANFPTVYQLGSPPHGPIHWQPQAAAFLGPMVTLENEADLMPDQDGLTNITPPLNAADQDMADDGVMNMPLVLPHCQPTTLSFTVTTVNPVDPMYVNVWFDWNRDADWDDILDCGAVPAAEWAVQNMPLTGLAPNTTYGFTTPVFLPWNLMGAQDPIWMRITLSERPYQLVGPGFGYGGAGPAGGYTYGETEDYYFVPGSGVIDGCCLRDGVCADMPPDQCLLHMGTPQGQLCTGVLEACCLPDMSCVMVDPLCCDELGGIPLGPDTQCTAPEACCTPDASTCLMADPLCCAAALGIPQGSGTICTEPQACCLGDHTCVDVDPLCCDELGGIPQGDDTFCSLVPQPTIPCCLPDGTCLDTHPLCCDDLGGTRGYAGACQGDLNGNGVDDACEAPVMACCLPNAACIDTNYNDCVARGGDPMGPGTSCAATICSALKWAQPPTFNAESPHPECFWGWDEISIFGSLQIAADDFYCADDRPITDVHWWGSYRGWDGIEPPPDAPAQFHIGIWTDIPAGTNGEYSHPGVLVWQSIVDRSALNERPVACDFHPAYMQSPEGCFRYDYQIPENEWFYQPGEGNVLWISISAIYAMQSPPNPWGWKTREHFYNDDAVVIWQPTAPTVGQPFVSGAPIWVGWDLSFVLTTLPKVQSKWSQPPHALAEGFDAPSDLWLHGPTVNKVEQLPNPALSGLHAHDAMNIPGEITQITIADDWVCDGGNVTAFEWWGNYEMGPLGELRGSGIAHFHLSIHLCMGGLPWCLPMDPAIWGLDVPFTAAQETDTGLINIEGGHIYHYSVTLPAPFPQELAAHYWFDLEAHSSLPGNPAIWRWQEARRDIAPPLELAPAAERTSVQGQPPGSWHSIQWPPVQGDQPRYSDMAFRVISVVQPLPEVNKVVADDFISDGRRIQAVRWWGSYFDARYQPETGGDPIHRLDGWLISFHHADPAVDPSCPPDLLAGDPAPTVLGVYFASPEAVAIVPTGLVDCFGHAIYMYTVDLRKCCLVCDEADPRTGDIPALPAAFHENHGLGYWLDVQAVTGARWVPSELSQCVLEYTGHLPSDQTADGHFWGWHTSPVAQLEEACTGQALLPPIPPSFDCWNYGNWEKQPWMCLPPPVDPVNMAFELLTRDIRGDCTNDGVVGLADHAVLVQCITGPDAGPIGAACACVDLDVDDDVDLYDFAQFQVVFEGP